MKEKSIRFEKHASHRMFARAAKFNIGEWDVHERVFRTVRRGFIPRKHKSKRHKTYYQYFPDNISIYVICKESESENLIKCTIKTVIVERGRE